MEKISYYNLPNCVRLTNDEIEMFVTTDVGPRIVGYSFIGGENILGLHLQAKVETELGIWKPYGGHRLWIAPENMPNSYAPDNAPVEYFFDEKNNSARFVQPIEPVTKTQKEITVTLDGKGSGVRINHRITNRGSQPFESAIWALTIVQGGGEVFIPNETFARYSPETLLPVRNLTCWSYTDFTDSRWRFEKDFIRLKVDENKPEPQKIGIQNKQGWAMYRRGNLEFVKKFDYIENALYPDLNSNTEIYVAGSFVEIESLAPLRRLVSGESAEHDEVWNLKVISE
ncbi:MAG: hypothetical protein M3Q99_06810 [Acidobacteriota bacterium]|nr:hypothetical protein [Acidobacteriota bacterium]